MRSLIDRIIAEAAGEERFLVAIAGPPAAGKSTLAQQLSSQFPAGQSAVVPMDGFHYDNAVLEQLQLRLRKGSPETFDFHGFEILLQRIRRMEDTVAIPLFDRAADLARAGAAIIPRKVKFVIVEGNYLLLNESPWSALRHYFHLNLFLNVGREELKRRLMRRWLDLGHSEEKAANWVTSNDMPNIDRVLNGYDEHCGAMLVHPQDLSLD